MLNESISTVVHTPRTLLAATPPSLSFGQKATLTATVSATSPYGAIATGTVTFWNGPTVLRIIPLRNAMAKLTTTNLHPGLNDIEAVYSGDQSFSGSTSQPRIVSVRNEQTRTKATSSPKTSVLGRPVLFTATVSPDGRGGTVPVGTVSFWDGSALLGKSDLSGGKARFSTALLSARTQTIRVVYNGQAGFGSSKASIRQTVKQAKPSTLRIAEALIGSGSDRH